MQICVLYFADALVYILFVDWIVWMFYLFLNWSPSHDHRQNLNAMIFLPLCSARHRVNNVLIANLRRTLRLLLMRLFRRPELQCSIIPIPCIFCSCSLPQNVFYQQLKKWGNKKLYRLRYIPSSPARRSLCSDYQRCDISKVLSLASKRTMVVHTDPYNETIPSSYWWYYCQRNMSRDAVHRDRTDDSSAKD